MKITNAILAFVLAAAAFASPAAAQSMAPVVHHIPVLVKNGRIYVYANVGSKKALLLVDTGAAVSTFKLNLVPAQHGVPVAMKIRTATGQSDCVRLETSVDIIGMPDTDVSRTLVGAIFGPFDFGISDGLLGADILLGGRYSSVSFDMEHIPNEMVLVEKMR